MREKYNEAFLPELGLETGGLSCRIHYCIIREPCYMEAPEPCAHAYTFRVNKKDGKIHQKM